ncbi:hypothetical protein NDN08_002890 [Rhodosorus marinus]|uniref:DUF6816 domain-containing protein n=1 Tax=Rhodosorus marinus TaxID=101924 RepID=A0AAV8UZA2_9RHOD|nr:hypothetical protein NDN08_002890 [Rhodosorus marinus]
MLFFALCTSVSTRRRAQIQSKSCASRREFLSFGLAVGPCIAFPGSLLAERDQLLPLEARLKTSDLKKPLSDPFPREPLVAEWMEGVWNVVVTKKAVQAPKGGKFLPDGYDLNRERSSIGKPLQYRLRFAQRRDGSGVATDRTFNLTSMMNAYAGTELVNNVEWDPNGIRSVALFKNSPGAKSIQILNTSATAAAKDRYLVEELFRNIFTNGNAGESPKTTDVETITLYRRSRDSRVEGSQRIAVYLTPSSDGWSAEYDDTAVLISDFTLEMTRL